VLRIRDPVLFWPLDPGSGMEKQPDPGSRMEKQSDPGSGRNIPHLNFENLVPVRHVTGMVRIT
jgi:hypothetical protein